jgi:arylsulfatase
VAFGKWHNTPASEATPRGPFDHWPIAYGFDHFYGFLGFETDQYSPRLFNDMIPVEPPRDPKYHLTEDLARQAIHWLEKHQTKSPGKPFFMYWAPGAVHAPHQVFKKWADKYKGKFDDGWDVYRKQVFQRQKSMGWIPADTVNTPRPQEMPAWNNLSPEEKKFQARLMEVYAGFLEHTDTQAGKIVNALERLHLRNNTLILYIFSDNGASSEGMQGSINDMVGLNGIVTTPEQHMKALNTIYGGLNALGGPKLEEHYHAAWAWAGESPFVGTKLVAGYFGGTRAPLALSWPRRITHDRTIRNQFHHVNDIAPTIYDILDITPPPVIGGVRQDPLDGVSMAYSFADAQAPTRKKRQYFEIMGSRAEYSDGWVASVFGPRKPWVADQSSLFTWAGKLAMLLHQPWIGDTIGWMNWNPEKDQWALYDLKTDFSEAHDLAATNHAKLEELKKKFDEDAEANHVNPLGASFDRMFHPRMHTANVTDWHFSGQFSRMPEPAMPNIKSQNHRITLDVDVPGHPSGVLFSLGGVGGGITLYVKDGVLIYEYNWFALTRTKIRSSGKLPPGHDIVEVEMHMSPFRWAGPATVTLRVNGRDVGKGEIPKTAPFAFSATGTFDVGQNLGSPVSLDYFDRAPFAFNGRIHDVHIQYR